MYRKLYAGEQRSFRMRLGVRVEAAAGRFGRRAMRRRRRVSRVVGVTFDRVEEDM